MNMFFSSTCCLMVILIATSCNKQKSDTDVGAVRSGEVVLTASSSGEKLVVRVDNNANEVVSIVDEPLVGFGLSNPRIGLVVQRDGKEVLPCAQVGMPRNQSPPTRLMPNQSKEREVSFDLVRKVYCLESGSYSLRAIYPSDSPSPSVSEEVFIKVEGAEVVDSRP